MSGRFFLLCCDGGASRGIRLRASHAFCGLRPLLILGLAHQGLGFSISFCPRLCLSLWSRLIRCAFISFHLGVWTLWASIFTFIAFSWLFMSLCPSWKPCLAMKVEEEALSQYLTCFSISISRSLSILTEAFNLCPQIFQHSFPYSPFQFSAYSSSLTPFLSLSPVPSQLSPPSQAHQLSLPQQQQSSIVLPVLVPFLSVSHRLRLSLFSLSLCFYLNYSAKSWQLSLCWPYFFIYNGTPISLFITYLVYQLPSSNFKSQTPKSPLQPAYPNPEQISHRSAQSRPHQPQDRSRLQYQARQDYPNYQDRPRSCSSNRQPQCYHFYKQFSHGFPKSNGLLLLALFLLGSGLASLCPRSRLACPCRVWRRFGGLASLCVNGMSFFMGRLRVRQLGYFYDYYQQSQFGVQFGVIWMAPF